MHSGIGITPDRRLILELTALTAMGISALSLGRMWVQTQKQRAEYRQQLIRQLFNDPGSVVRRQKQDGELK